ncbi:Oxygen-regulated invasion protein OrgA [Pandoraea terrae]|uniref:Oxygen-regulated invasion protein OrgA n=1 Tax=Pandoraea terrae TaxID=1537710 RepID=A0A5E4TDU7_9BURK|nr:type III secretion apparatus protein OrgA/MxiK [Pandoraea terrae]VVD84708.1 Oxygen-regulated invasion protein OrgA [Pandoraea terrae]
MRDRQPQENRQNSWRECAIAWRAAMFDPVSYIHPSRFAAFDACKAPRQRRIINDFLIRSQGLTVHWPHEHIGIVERLWLKHWQRLPQIAYLLGCQHHRAGLCQRGALLRLPEWAAKFALLPLIEPATSVPGKAPSHRALLVDGARRLIALASSLPEPLRQRVPLLFPPCEGQALLFARSTDVRLFVIAFEYAKTHPGVPPDDGG